MESTTGTDPVRAGHDVLLAMAGRLPDRLLWRLRDWLAAGADVAVRTALPRALVRHRVGITDTERALLRDAVLGWGGSSRQVDAVLHADAAPGTDATFTAVEDGPGWDTVDLVLQALVPTVDGVGELRRAWRTERGAGFETPSPARVVIVGATVGPASLTGALQRALRAHGEVDPRVEVLAPDSRPTAYHRAALASSEILWRAGAALLDAPGRWAEPDAHRARTFGELVRHG